MLHRHVNPPDWTLAAVDDVTPRALSLKQLVTPQPSEISPADPPGVRSPSRRPARKRAHFWNYYVRAHAA
jgi:hypothetical protein